MAILVTGGAGFIGYHVCKALLDRADEVVIVDDFNDYYEPDLKEYRIGQLPSGRFELYRIDIQDYDALKKVFDKHEIKEVVHLAARAGVRASIKDPALYAQVNVVGTTNLLELSKKVDNFIFATSSSVYGGNTKVPFSEDDPANNPISPYAATKRGAEIMCHAYHKLYGMPITCLRFFTVYGPMGRPDMAYYKFTNALLEGKEVSRFGDGSMKRDFTYVDDIVPGVLAALDNPQEFEIINLGNSKPVELSRFISVIEEAVGKKANVKELPVPAGDVPVTYADVSKAKKLLGWEPKTTVEEGIPKFVEWYKEYAKGL
jgi:UDP-glucuronate 4-epimerase